jgi:presenilin-like A22 family membrane protease
MKKIFLYFVLMFISVFLFKFVDVKAENIFSYIAPLSVLAVILYVYIDNFEEN